MTTDRIGRMSVNMIASDIGQDGSIGDRDRPLWVTGYSSPNQKIGPPTVRCRNNADLIEADR